MIGNKGKGFAVSIGGEKEPDVARKAFGTDIIRGRKGSLRAAIASKFGFEGPLTEANFGKLPHFIIIAMVDSRSSRKGASRMDSKSCASVCSKRQLFNRDRKKTNDRRCGRQKKVACPETQMAEECPKIEQEGLNP